MEYVDLYLIHFPVSLKPGSRAIPFPPEDVLLMDFKSVWEAMEKCHNLGLSKNIGVSNFSSKKLQTILSFAKIPPAINQVSTTHYNLMQMSIWYKCVASKVRYAHALLLSCTRYSL